MQINSIQSCNYSQNYLKQTKKNPSFGFFEVTPEAMLAAERKLNGDKCAYSEFTKRVEEFSKIKLNLEEILYNTSAFRSLGWFMKYPVFDNDVKAACIEKMVAQFIEAIGPEQSNEYTFKFEPQTWGLAPGYIYKGCGINHKTTNLEEVTDIEPEMIQKETELLASNIDNYNPLYDIFGSSEGYQVCLPKNLKEELGLTIYFNLAKILENNHKLIYQAQFRRGGKEEIEKIISPKRKDKPTI